MWQTLSETTAFENYWVKVRLQQVRLPNGKEYEYTIVDRPTQGVTIFLFDDEGRLLMEREYRHSIGRTIWQVPGGLMDEDEQPLVSAQRELREETGYVADEWHELTEVYDNPALGNAHSIIFVARQPRLAHETKWDEAESVEIEWVTLEWLKEKIQQGEIIDRMVLSGLGMLWARGWL